jgi:hypothetical protein
MHKRMSKAPRQRALDAAAVLPVKALKTEDAMVA